MPSVGEILAAERRRQGKALNDAVEGTKIRSRLLDALENGRYAELPSPAYVKGYIQSYARFLEIPAEPLLDQYRKEAALVERPLSAVDRYMSQIPHETVVPGRDQAHAIPRNVWIATAAVVLVVALLICGISSKLLSGSTSSTPSEGTTPASEVTASPGAEATEPTGEAPGAFDLRVSVKEGFASWIQATVDGKVTYDGTLNGGESREWRVNGTVVLKIGKPDAVTVTRGGSPVVLPKGANVQVDLKSIP
jgi:cytoskeleton protein RodZ